MKKTLLTLLLCCLSITTAQAAKTIPDYEKFGSLPMISKPDISPDGKYIAAIYNNDGEPTVVISEFGKSEITPILKLKRSIDRIDFISWANNNRLLIGSSYSTPYMGDRIRVSRLYAINKDGSNLQEIKKKLRKDAPRWLKLYSTSNILSYLPNDPDHILLQLFDERDKGYSVFKVNINEYDFEKVVVNTYDVTSWVANKNGDILFGYGFDKINKDIMHMYYRTDNSQPFKLVKSVELFKDETFDPVMIIASQMGDKLIVISDHEIGRSALWQYDVKTAKFEKLIYAADGFDISSVIFNKERNKVIGVKYFDHYLKAKYFDQDYEKEAQLVKNSFKKYQTNIASRSEDRKRLLVAAVKDNTPTKYFWLDLQKRGGGFWFSQYPYLEREKLANVKPFDFKARDGMTIHGYLTLPVNANKNTKLIVWPHGGPQARDYQYFDQFVQFFAHKGYAVLQVNYRGSTGYGNKYQTAGYRQWGKAMQNDIYDAIAWLEKQNLINTKQACMVGASYGGYASLTAAFQKPDRFQCIISIAGIGDVHKLVKTEYKYKTKRAFLRKTVGDLDSDEDIAMLKSVSAIEHIDRIKAPVLLIHGTYDTQVRTSQSREFYQAMKKSGKNIRYVELDHGTHYLDENENRIATFKAMDEFLSKYL